MQARAPQTVRCSYDDKRRRANGNLHQTLPESAQHVVIKQLRCVRPEAPMPELGQRQPLVAGAERCEGAVEKHGRAALARSLRPQHEFRDAQPLCDSLLLHLAPDLSHDEGVQRVGGRREEHDLRQPAVQLRRRLRSVAAGSIHPGQWEAFRGVLRQRRHRHLAEVGGESLAEGVKLAVAAVGVHAVGQPCRSERQLSGALAAINRRRRTGLGIGRDDLDPVDRLGPQLHLGEAVHLLVKADDPHPQPRRVERRRRRRCEPPIDPPPAAEEQRVPAPVAPRPAGDLLLRHALRDLLRLGLRLGLRRRLLLLRRRLLRQLGHRCQEEPELELL